jgi:hypothetical protein
VTDVQLDKLQKLLLDSASQISEGRFEARPASHRCGSCAYKATCPSAYSKTHRRQKL